MPKHSHTEPEVEPVVSEEPISETEDYKEKWQRALAEAENMRKRFEQERQGLRQYALEGFVLDLLPVVDNFYRATEHIPEDQRNASWVTGIQYIQKSLVDTLEKYGVQEISTNVGDVFNPVLHEAVEAVAGDLPEDHITTITRKGYRLHDRIIRPVQVIVNK